MKPIRVLPLILFLIPPILLAGGKATLQGGKGGGAAIMELEYAESGKVRMNMPQEQGGSGYMLARDGKAWMVMNVEGQVMVMDVAQMAGMARDMGAPSGDEALKHQFIEAKNTGRKEGVAGYEGEVYKMTWRDRRGTHTAEVVLSSHPDVVEFSRAWMKFASSMSRAVAEQDGSENSIGEYLNKEGKGLLRMGDEFRVVSIEPGKVDESRFTLPKATLQMPKMPR